MGPAGPPSASPRSTPKRLRHILAVLRDAFGLWSSRGATRHAAALAFYTLFSLAPLLIILTAIIGAVFGVQVGNEGRERESIARQGAETRAAQAAALVEPERGERLVEMWRDSTANGNPGEEAF